jgi:sugar-specific transcriptional regulator TrmB
MSVSERTKKAMQDFGLTDYETRVYLNLLQSEEMVASEISKIANVPYSRVYEVLSDLERKGWIESNDGRPKNYRARPPLIALENTKNKIEKVQKINEEQILGELLPLFENKKSFERPEIWIVRGESNIIERAKDAISQSRKEVLLALPFITKNISENFSPLLIYLKSRGIKVTILASDASSKILKRFNQMAEIRVRDKMFGGGIISDSKEVLLLLGGEAESSEPIAICSSHVSLAKFAKEYFEWLFNTSKRI